MTLEEIKELTEYIISKKISYIKAGDVEIQTSPESWLSTAAEPEVSLEDVDTDTIARTLKAKTDNEKREYLKELFNV